MSEEIKIPEENQMNENQVAKVPWKSYDLYLIFIGTFLLVMGISQGLALVLRQSNLAQYAFGWWKFVGEGARACSPKSG